LIGATSKFAVPDPSSFTCTMPDVPSVPLFVSTTTPVFFSVYLPPLGASTSKDISFVGAFGSGENASPFALSA
jgi:hypothetical protein